MAKPSKLPNGKWRIRYVDQNSKRASAVFDTYSDANFFLSNASSEVEKIKRGLKLGFIEGKTFNELIDIYLICRTPLKARPQDDHSIINAHLRKAFGHLKLTEIKATHIDLYKLNKKHLHKKTVNHQLTLMTTMLNYAVEINWLVDAPKIKKHKIKLFDKDFNYLRTAGEIHQLLSAAKVYGYKEYVLLGTAIYTGMRQGELGGLKRKSIDLNRRLICVESSFQKGTKSGEVRFVPILDPLLPILREWLLYNPCEFVFPNQNGEMLKPCSRIFQENFRNIIQNAGFQKIIKNGREREYVVFHDLRHTFASHWVMNGGDIFKLQKILGHSSVAMTMRYAHLAPDAFVSDYNLFGDPVTHQNGSVISFGKLAEKIK